MAKGLLQKSTRVTPVNEKRLYVQNTLENQFISHHRGVIAISKTPTASLEPFVGIVRKTESSKGAACPSCYVLHILHAPFSVMRGSGCICVYNWFGEGLLCMVEFRQYRVVNSSFTLAMEIDNEGKRGTDAKNYQRQRD